MKIEIRNDTAVISGYVNAVGRDSRPITDVRGKFVEQIEPGAFRASLERSEKVDLLLNHDKSKVYASTKDGNLKLTEDNIGLRAEAVLTDAEMIRKARSGEFRGWSFGMYVGDSAMEERAEGIPRRHVKSLNMFEVSLIDKSRIPCYVGTSVECRAEGEDVLAELRYSAENVEVVFDKSACGNDGDINLEFPEKPVEERSEPEVVDYSAVDDVISELRYGAVDNVIAELRYNPYHDPSNGRFCSGGGSGGGGVLVVEQGQKGKGYYVVDANHDEEYEKWLAQKSAEKSKSDSADIYNRKFATPEEYKQALAEKYNGITDVSKIKTAKDVSDFINYDTQSRYYGSTGDRGNRMIQSTWKEGLYGYNTKGFGYGVEISPVKTAVFSDDGTTILEMPKGYSGFKNNTHVFDDSIAKLEKAGIRVGHWHDDTYMVTKKKGARTSKWLEGLESSRSFDPIESKLEELRK